jgi:hypothetical protein
VELDAAALASRASEAQRSPSSRLKAVAPADATPLSEAEKAAIDRAAAQLQQQPGSQIVLVQVRGGSPVQRASVERSLTRNSFFDRWAAIDTADGMVIVLDSRGGLGFVRGSITYTKLTAADDQFGVAALSIDGPFSAGQRGERSGRGMAGGAIAATGPGGPQPTTFDDLVQQQIQRLEQDVGPGKYVVVNVVGSTAPKRKALEAELIRLTSANRRGSAESPDRTVFYFHYEGDVQALAQKIRLGQAQVTDASKRELLVTME